MIILDRIPYILMLVFSALISMLLSVIAFRSRHRVLRAKPFSMMAICSSLWMISVSVDSITNNLVLKEVLSTLISFFIYSALIGLLIFSMEFSLHLTQVPKAVLYPLATITLLITIFTATNRLHHMVSTFELINGSYKEVIGNFSWIKLAFMYLLVLAILIILIRALILSKGVLRITNALLFIGILIPVTVSIASDVLGWDPLPFVDEPALSIIIPVLLFGWATFRFNALNFMPIASNVIIKNMQDAVLVTDTEGIIIFSNPTAQLVLGKIKTLLNGRHVSRVLEDWLPEAANVWKDKKEEVQLTIGQDEAKYFRLTISKLHNSGEFTGYLLMIYNNTEQKNNENRLKSIFAAVSDPLFIIDKETGAILDVNDSACRVYGYSREEILKLKATDMSAEPEETRKAMDEPRNLIPVRRHKKKDGTVFMVEITASFFELNGRSVLATSMRDITERRKTEVALHESEQRLSSIINTTGDVIFLLDIKQDGEFWFNMVNPAFLTTTGLKAESVLGKRVRDIIPEPSLSLVLGKYRQAIQEKTIVRWEETSDYPTGKLTALVTISPIINPDGTCRQLVGNAHDITKRKQAEEELKNSQLLLSAGIESPKNMIILAIDKDYNYLFFNQVHKNSMKITYGKEVEIGMNLLECITSEVDVLNAKSNYGRALNGEVHSTVQEFGDKKRIFFETFYSPIINENSEIIGATAYARDITERKKTENAIIYLSFHDQLTDLYNRRFFEEEIKRLDTARQLPLSIIMGDLNSLKIVNDVFGHAEGDKLLIEISIILKEVCRTDDILARWGGDEFVVLLPRTNATDSEEVVRRIINKCKNTNTSKIPASLSLGTATKEKSDQDIQAVIMDAESNMYKNKLAQKESLTSSIIFALDTALYEKSNETKEHTDRIRKLAIRLGRSIKLPANQIDEISLLASLHDIGKVAIPEKILLKKGRLTEKEWSVIKRHPEIGFNIAQSSPQIAHIAKPILSCHENWDGSGYPLGLKGEAIPIISRIVLITDAYDVMTSKRTYKEPMSKDDSIGELKRCAGTQFDPFLVDKFIEIISN